jgi:carbon storage regulator
MLVLSRRMGEEIVINSNVRVKVSAIKGQTVRLGITAPPTVVVMRGELFSKRLDEPYLDRQSEREKDSE